MIEDFEKYDYHYYLSEALKRVPSGIDKREGSIIYDAVAPVAYSFAEMAMNMKSVVLNAYTQTAWGQWLDYKAAEGGTKREPATYARVLAEFTDNKGNPLKIDVGDRFSSVGANPVFYTATKATKSLSSGQTELTAETLGTAANGVIGQLLPVTPNDKLGGANIIEIIVPARDVETDEDLRERLLNNNQVVHFGGNVADYVDFTKSMENIGAVQVYPTWNGGGTVRVVVLNNTFTRPSQPLIDEVQNAIDPLDAQSEGYGIAPIGHKVTVAAPTNRAINVNLRIETTVNITVQDVKNLVENAVSSYFEDVRKTWDKLVSDREYKVTVYRSQLMMKVLAIDGIVNVTDVKLDGAENDITVETTKTLQELPIVGSVIVNG